MIEYKDIIQCGQIDARKLIENWEGKISGVINLAYNIEPPIVYPKWLPLLYRPAWDERTPDIEWFKPVIAFYESQRRNGQVIVHCQAGGNRSRGTFGVLLVACHGMSAREALKITGQPGYPAWRIAIENYAKHLGSI